MLNEIFNSNITPDPLREEEGGDVMNQGRKNKEDEFLNEEFQKNIVHYMIKKNLFNI